MARIIMGLALVLMLAPVSYAENAETGQLNFTVGGGINVPSAEGFDNGYVFGGGLGYRVAPRLVVSGEVAYLGYPSIDGSSQIGNDTVDYSASHHFTEYMGAAKLFVADGKTAPYLKGFVGRYDYGVSASIGGMSMDETYSDMQFGAGVGMLIRGDAESNLCIEALVHSLQGEESSESIFTVTMGMDVDFTP